MFITEPLRRPAGGSAGGTGLIIQFLPFILIFVIMYFLILRPQQQRQRQHREMIANVRRGDTVVTTGGIIGKVAKVDETRIAGRSGRRYPACAIVRGMIAEVRTKGEPVKENG